jgi:nucleoside-diphosphate-sugar epimerase
LVTGASGFLGRYVVEELKRRGHEVYAGVRRTSDTAHLLSLGVELREFDLRDKGLMTKALSGMESVVHLAAYYTFNGNKESYRRLNVEATEDLADAALSEGIGRFVYCSSTEAIGPTEGTADETSPLRPEYEYGRSKVAAEKVLEQKGSKGLDHVVLRPSGIYGPHNVDDVSYWFITSYSRRLATKFIVGDGNHTIQFVHAADVAAAFGLALENEGSKGRTYIISEGRSYTYNEVYGMLGEITGIPPPKVHVPPSIAKTMIAPIQFVNWLAKRDDFMYRLSTVDSVTSDRSYSTERARKELGYEPRFNLRRGLEETYGWYKENGYLR